MTASERRAGTRRAADWRVLFGRNGELAHGFLADMSPMGVSILCADEYAVGTEIEMHFGVPDDQSSGRLQLRGVVKHCGKGRIGVQFLDMQPTDREHWWKIMRSDF